jgi:glycerophosphoryl diester phosphodiesterase
VVWTVNETADMKRMVELGVDGIITDYPDRAAQIRQ